MQTPILVLNYAMFVCPGPSSAGPDQGQFSRMINKNTRVDLVGCYEDFKMFNKFMQRNFAR